MEVNFSLMNKIKQKEILILILCLLVGFALRFYSFDQKSLWIDEIHTYNDSSDDLKGQLNFYKENPTYLHPPLFFILTHLFYPFTNPETDLRIIPLIFGILSIPMIYLLSRSFSPNIALPCTISLTFMTYHIYFSQDGRSYSLLMFFGMASIYFFLKYRETLKKKYLIVVPLFFAILFHLSYSSIVFISLCQILWFFRVKEKNAKIDVSSFLILNGITLFLCSPWILFLAINYKGQPIMDPITFLDIGSFSSLLKAILNDWVPHAPLTIASLFLLILFPFFSSNRINSLILLSLFIIPVGGLFSYLKLFNITQFIGSRYFINFLPLFFVTLYLSLDAIEFRFFRTNRRLRPNIIFLILFIASNLMILPLYYRAEKQDFRRLVYYLNTQLRDKDKIIVGTFTYIPGILHYFNVNPQNRHYNIPYSWIVPGKEFEFKLSLVSQGRSFDICHSNIPYVRYVEDGGRLWIIVGKERAKEIEKNYPCVLKGYFDGSFSFFRRFPSDASMYLLLWDPLSPHKNGIEMQSK